MNRTIAFLGTAAALALLSLGVRPAARPPPPPGAPTPIAPRPMPPGSVAQDGAVRLEARLAHPFLPVGHSEAFATVDVQARPAEGSAERAPVRIALAIDRSGSMQGEKLAQARRAAHHLLSQLTRRDRLSIVHYGSDVKVLPELPVTPGNREQLSAFIDSIYDEGGTNLSGGLEAAFRQLATSVEGTRSRRLILISDGQPNEGISDTNGLLALAARMREQGVAVSAIGVGLDFNDTLMQGLAQRGGGFYGYLKDASRLAEIFGRELDQATRAVARNPELSLTLPPGVQLEEVMGQTWSSDGDTVRIPLYDLAAGLSARVVVRLSVTADAAGEKVPVAALALRYTDARTGEVRQAEAGLSGTATSRPEEVETHADAEALTSVHRALGAKQLAVAAEQFRQGHRESAFSLLDNVRSLFGASAEALSGDIQELDRTRAAMAAARTPDEVEHQSKDLVRRNLRNFGNNASY